MKKEANFEILKILLMFMVLSLHTYSLTGLLTNKTNFTNNTLIWLLESLAYIAVNVYVILNGYFMIKKEFKIERILKIWIRTFLYSQIIMISLGKIEVRGFIENFIPITSERYWFVSAFILLQFFTPLLNKAVSKMTKSNYRMMLIVFLILFSVLPVLYPSNEVYLTNGGYSFIWFIILYLIGGYISLYDIKIKKRYCFIIYVSIAFLLTSMKCFLPLFEFFNNKYILHYTHAIYSYNSLLVLIASISFFLIFKNIKIKVSDKKHKLITNLANASFGIYLIHENKILKPILWSNPLLLKFTKISDPLLIPKVLLVLLVLYSLMMLVSLIIESFLKIIYNWKFNKVYKIINNKIKY